MPPASLGEDVPVASGLAAVGSMERDVPQRKEVRQFPSRTKGFFTRLEGDTAIIFIDLDY